MNCTPGHSNSSAALALNDTTAAACHCYAPYYGVQCELTRDYYIPLSITFVVVDTLVMLLGLAWIFLRLVTITRAKRWSKHRLADVVVLLNGLAMIMQLIVDLTPTPSLTGIWPSSLELSIFRGILVILSMATWMATSALILGFWLDVLRRRMKVQLRPCTRILCLVGAALLLAVVPGIILLYVFANLTGDVFRTVGSVLLVLPFVLNTAVMVVVAALVTVRLRARLLLMNAGTKRRSLHARGWIWTLTAAWILYLLTIVFVLAAATLSSPVTTFAYEAILLVCRACVILSILMLADGHRRCNNCHFDTSISVSMATTPRTPSTVRNSSASSSSSTA